ncbi:hypothetical protein QTN25_002111 [Entamoeba marina]
MIVIVNINKKAGLKIDLPENAKVMDLKKKIFSTYCIEVSYLTVKYNNVVLDDEKPIEKLKQEKPRPRKTTESTQIQKKYPTYDVDVNFNVPKNPTNLTLIIRPLVPRCKLNDSSDMEDTNILYEYHQNISTTSTVGDLRNLVELHCYKDYVKEGEYVALFHNEKELFNSENGEIQTLFILGIESFSFIHTILLPTTSTKGEIGNKPINVKLMHDKKESIKQFKLKQTVLDLRKEIAKENNINPDKIYLVYGNQKLEDNKKNT